MKKKRKRPSNRRLAKRIGVSPQAVDQWFSGATRPSLENAIRLAMALKLTLDEAVLLVQEEVMNRHGLMPKE